MLCSMHKVLSSIPSINWRQEDQKFKASLNYRESWKTAWIAGGTNLTPNPANVLNVCFKSVYMC